MLLNTDTTKPSPGAKMFAAALCDVVQRDEATGHDKPLHPLKTGATTPGHKAQWLDTGPPKNKEQVQDTDTNGVDNETPWPTNVEPFGNKTQWLDTGTAKPPRNKTQWPSTGKLEMNENKAKWSDSVTKPVDKAQWRDDDVKPESKASWKSPNPVDPGSRARWRDIDADKMEAKNQLDTTTIKPKKQNNNFSSIEPVFMKLPKVTIASLLLTPLFRTSTVTI